MLGYGELPGIKVSQGQIMSIVWSHSCQKGISTIKPLLLKIVLILFFKISLRLLFIPNIIQ